METQKQRFIEQLTSAEIKGLEKRMRPGNWSGAGFLGKKERLQDVIQRDAVMLAEQGITHKQVGDRLESLTGQYFTQLHRSTDNILFEPEVMIDGFQISGQGWRGQQDCPFSASEFSRCGAGSYNFTIEKGTKKIEFPVLMAHLVRDHHFFEGKTSYRLDPAKAIAVLGLRSGVDYTPKRETEIYWSSIGCSNSIETDFVGSAEIKRMAKNVVSLGPGVKLYVLDEKCLILAEKDLKCEQPLKIDGHRCMIHGQEISRGTHVYKKTEHSFVVG